MADAASSRDAIVTRAMRSVGRHCRCGNHRRDVRGAATERLDRCGLNGYRTASASKQAAAF